MSNQQTGANSSGLLKLMMIVLTSMFGLVSGIGLYYLKEIDTRTYSMNGQIQEQKAAIDAIKQRCDRLENEVHFLKKDVRSRER